jgi:hypothetical protein
VESLLKKLFIVQNRRCPPLGKIAVSQLGNVEHANTMLRIPLNHFSQLTSLGGQIITLSFNGNRVRTRHGERAVKAVQAVQSVT